MYSDVLYSFTIGFVGAILFLLVDKYEPEGPLARSTEISDPVRRWRGDPAQIAALRFGWRGRAHNDPLVIASFCGSDLQRNAP